MRQILLNKIVTPDGTELISRHRHDCVFYEDKNGLTYMNDGGLDYFHRTEYPQAPYIDESVFSDEPIEKIREVVSRGGRGKNGDEPLKQVLLKDMSNEWLINCIEYEKEHRPYNPYISVYKRELEYRGEKNIYIDDN